MAISEPTTAPEPAASLAAGFTSGNHSRVTHRSASCQLGSEDRHGEIEKPSAAVRAAWCRGIDERLRKAKERNGRNASRIHIMGTAIQ
jgi:hypothetical protein